MYYLEFDSGALHHCIQICHGFLLVPDVSHLTWMFLLIPCCFCCEAFTYLIVIVFGAGLVEHVLITVGALGQPVVLFLVLLSLL